MDVLEDEVVVTPVPLLDVEVVPRLPVGLPVVVGGVVRMEVGAAPLLEDGGGEVGGAIPPELDAACDKTAGIFRNRRPR